MTSGAYPDVEPPVQEGIADSEKYFIILKDGALAYVPLTKQQSPH